MAERLTQHERYRASRAAGIPAVRAHRLSADQPVPPGFTYELRSDGTIRFVPLAHLDLAGLDIAATVTPDTDPDLSWVGEFNNTWAPGALIAGDKATASHRYFHPSHSVTERREHLASEGHSRSVAYEIAMAHAHDDLCLARDPNMLIVNVAITKAGVELGDSGVGNTVLDPSRDFLEQIVEVITDYRLVDDAVDQARDALRELALIAAHVGSHQRWRLGLVVGGYMAVGPASWRTCLEFAGFG